jgi:hypothetical protein
MEGKGELERKRRAEGKGDAEGECVGRSEGGGTGKFEDGVNIS